MVLYILFSFKSCLEEKFDSSTFFSLVAAIIMTFPVTVVHFTLLSAVAAIVLTP